MEDKKGHFVKAKTWLDAFQQLRDLLKRSRKRKKKIVFIDEMPWLDTPKSDFLTALEHFWTNYIENSRHRAWNSYAFEQVCLFHLPQKKQKLGISGVLTKTYSWRSNEKDNGAQIDLIIDK